MNNLKSKKCFLLAIAFVFLFLGYVKSQPASFNNLTLNPELPPLPNEGGQMILKGEGSSNDYVIDNYSGLLRFFNRGIERVNFMPNGEVGIGLRPATRMKLDVNGNTYIRGNLYLTDPNANSSTGSKLILGSGSANGAFHSIGINNYGTEFRSDQTRGWQFVSSSNGVNYTTRFIIQGGSGNTGINTANPTKTLDVNGETRLRTLNNAPSTGVFPVLADANGVLYKGTAPYFTGGWVSGQSCPSGFIISPDPDGNVCKNVSGETARSIISNAWCPIPANYRYCNVCARYADRENKYSNTSEVVQVHCVPLRPQNNVLTTNFNNDTPINIPVNPNQNLSWITQDLTVDFRVIPNPSNGHIVLNLIESESTIQKVTVTNMDGKQVFEQIANNNQLSIDLSPLKNGAYIINIETNKGKRGVQKFIKN